MSAFFTYSYLKAIELLRQKEFKKSDKGVPLEYFEWERVVVDEVHECLCTDKDNLQLDYFKEKNRRASRELLGITQKDVKQRYAENVMFCDWIVAVEDSLFAFWSSAGPWYSENRFLVLPELHCWIIATVLLNWQT